MIKAPLFFVGLFLLTSSAVAAPAKNTPGLVEEKPAAGRFVKTTHGYMVPYTAKIPGTDVTFEMVPISGGTFTMGSPKNEPGRNADEGPQFKVKVAPFWMSKYENTWAEYKQFMVLYESFKGFDSLRSSLADPKKREATLKAIGPFRALKNRVTEKDDPVDAITTPTKLYDPSFTFELGERPQQPAVTMTQYAAKQYTKWLSGMSGQFYRLPSEAEWEYAARAGAKTAYHFGDDPKKLGQYEWYDDNGDETTHDIGKKKPNAWGLYDMHGNVAEWVLDQYVEEGHARHKGKTVTALESVAWPTKESPRVIKGGSWQDGAELCRAAARLAGEGEDWKAEDPNLPLSPWWYTDDPTRGIGFRMIRPLAAATKDLKKKVWEIDAKLIRLDVEGRLTDRRGTQGPTNRDLPKAIEELKAYKKTVAKKRKGKK